MTPAARPPPAARRRRRRDRHLTICLLCPGPGGAADPSVYRPSRDDARYRHRHDALVRCVASSLHGGANANANANAEGEGEGEGWGDRPITGGRCELVFVYDGDMSCLRMSLAPPPHSSSSSSSAWPPPPLEADVVASWRDASREAARVSRMMMMRPEEEGRASSTSVVGSILKRRDRGEASNGDGNDDDDGGAPPPRLRTTCVLDSWKTVGPSSSSSSSSSLSSSPSFESSRGGQASSASARGGNDARADVGRGGRPSLPSRVPSSKREAVSALQRTCPVEYLREHRLNVSCDVALRKFNWGKLRAIWEEYGRGGCARDADERRDGRDVGRDGSEAAGIGCGNDDEERRDRMERTFRAILSTTKGSVDIDDDDDDDGAMANNGNDCLTRVVAAYLHESCDAELPCWGWDRDGTDSIDDDDAAAERVFLFLGAVRDMTESESHALSRACRAMSIPLVPCRLSPVPEFTSKILSVAGYHFFRRALGGALVELWRRRHRLSREMNSVKSLPPTYPQSNNRTIHAIAMVPMGSRSLSADPLLRNRIMWCMVRLCVCSLWRSRLASDSTSSSSSSSSSSSTKALNNMLTFLFEDGVQITLSQKEFTSALAEKHRAAPSERQILEELCDRRDASTSMPNGRGVKQTCKDILLSSKPSGDDHHDTFALDFTKRCDKPNEHSSREIINLAYSNRLFQKADWDRRMNTPSWTLFTVLRVRSDLNSHSCDSESASRTEMVHKALLRSLTKAGIQVRSQTSLLGDSSQDDEACTVTMLQHLDYQGYLYQLLNSLREDENDGGIIGKGTKLKKKKRRKLKSDT